jgi:hypothetical protein
MAKKAAARTKAAKKKSLPLKTQVLYDIDKALGKSGIPSAIDKDGWRWLQDPSGEGLIGVAAVVGHGEDLSLRVVAPIMPLPTSKPALFRLLKKIAETNYEVPGHSRLAIDSRTVWSVVAHTVSDIGPDDVPNCIFDCLWLAQATADGLKGKKTAVKKTAKKTAKTTK